MTRLEQLLQLRTRIHEEIQAEQARTAATNPEERPA